ncbi:hypothetical protein [Algiphilus aromaticivorans]|uniref:hypothetical protein n=1 Tax=Algiphilus aromaticivorans TaxID=382454 RepID=UPI0005C24917|nr:hypothetical protein [Algiphilus aromaticivorans]
MTSIHRLTPDTARALAGGRALAFLVDYRHPGLADHTFTIVGFLDSQSFEGTLVPDDDPECELVRCELPLGPCFVAETSLESADARAVHELWASWTGGVHEDYLRLLDFLASARARARLMTALAATETDEKPKKKSRTAARNPSRRARKAKRAEKGRRS